MIENIKGDGLDLVALYECAYSAMCKQVARIVSDPDVVEDIVQSTALGMMAGSISFGS